MSFRTQEAVKGYTEGWMKGDLKRAKGFLDSKVTFQDPVNSFSTADDLIAALEGFRRVFKDAKMLREFYDGDEAVLLYDCVLATPSGKLRCAEYFRTKDGKVKDIKLVFDATELNKLMGK